MHAETGTRMYIYKNTSENARRVGWAFVPEYVYGDSTKPFVRHNHRNGTFTYVTAEELEPGDQMASDNQPRG